MTLTLIMALIIVNIALVVLVRRQNNKTRKHLRQIEKKIDETYTQIRSDKYAHPSAYHFVEKKF